MSADHAFAVGQRLWTAMLLASAFVLLAYSQSSITPPPGDPQVFLMYLRQAHRAISDLAQARSTNSPEATGALQRSAAARLHVEVGNLVALESVYQSATAALSVVDTEGRGYVVGTRQKGQTPDMARLRDYDRRRTQILQQAGNQLQTAIGQASWLRLRAYLDGEFRMHVKRREL